MNRTSNKCDTTTICFYEIYILAKINICDSFVTEINNFMIFNVWQFNQKFNSTIYD